MRASIHLGRLAGIPIGLHYSWLIIASLVTVSLASHFRTTYASWSPSVAWLSGGATAVLLFGTLILHELSHALVAQSRGLPVRSITLFALGGIAQIEKTAHSAAVEFSMAVAGPLTSVVIGGTCVAVARQLGWSLADTTASPPVAVLGWLGSINLALAVFNLVPGYPLDGGRVLRAILWRVSGNAERATQQAASVGQFVASMFIVFGALRFLAGRGIDGLWIAFIGWFLLDAARASYAEVELTASLQGIRASDIMSRDCATVPATTPVDAFADQMLRTGRRCFLVAGRHGEVEGLITPHEIRGIDRERWTDLQVRNVMRPLDALKTVGPQTPVAEALALMAREDVNQLPVVEGGRLLGVVAREHVLRLIQTRAELNA